MKRNKSEDFDFDMEEEVKFKIGGIGNSSRIISRNVKQNEYLYPLDYELAEFEDVDDLIKLLASASHGDVVIIYINSGGGRVDISSLIINRIKEAQGRGVVVVGELGFEVASAATFIALACDDLIVPEEVNFMVHAWSGGLPYTNATEQLELATFNKKQSDKFLRRVYKDFLTDEELDDLIAHPKDLNFDADEVRERWERVKGTDQDAPEQIQLEDYVIEKVNEVLMSHGLIEKPKSKRKKKES
jgi:ATP-dependent protease ClpP protease subunit